MSGGELYSLIEKKGKFSESEAKKYFCQILSAVDHIHRNGIVHRDLKPENILLDEHKNIKLGDFGLSGFMKDGEFLLTACGSANYAAPEVITGLSYCGTEADIWSLGILLFALLSGTLPFDETNVPALLQKMKTAKFTMPYHISAEASDLIRKIIIANPVERITLPMILEHPWVKGHENLNLYTRKIGVNLEIVEELLRHTRFAGINDVELVKINILSDVYYDLFTVSYEILLCSRVEWQNSQRNSKKMKLTQMKKYSFYESPPNDWKYGFILDSPPGEIMENLCQILKDMDAKWIFFTPFHLKTIFRDVEKKRRVKITGRLYSVRVT